MTKLPSMNTMRAAGYRASNLFYRLEIVRKDGSKSTQPFRFDDLSTAKAVLAKEGGTLYQCWTKGRRTYHYPMGSKEVAGV